MAAPERPLPGHPGAPSPSRRPANWSAISDVAPRRKTDPGELFELAAAWRRRHRVLAGRRSRRDQGGAGRGRRPARRHRPTRPWTCKRRWKPSSATSARPALTVSWTARLSAGCACWPESATERDDAMGLCGCSVNPNDPAIRRNQAVREAPDARLFAELTTALERYDALIRRPVAGFLVIRPRPARSRTPVHDRPSETEIRPAAWAWPAMRRRRASRKTAWCGCRWTASPRSARPCGGAARPLGRCGSRTGGCRRRLTFGVHALPWEGQTVGWPPSARDGVAGGGKSGLHGNTVPGNARRGRPQGKCHRKQTAFRRLGGGGQG